MQSIAILLVCLFGYGSCQLVLRNSYGVPAFDSSSTGNTQTQQLGGINNQQQTQQSAFAPSPQFGFAPFSVPIPTVPLGNQGSTASFSAPPVSSPPAQSSPVDSSQSVYAPPVSSPPGQSQTVDSSQSALTQPLQQSPSVGTNPTGFGSSLQGSFINTNQPGFVPAALAQPSTQYGLPTF